MSLVSFTINDRNFVTAPPPLPPNLLSRYIHSSYKKKAPLFNSGSSLKQTEKKTRRERGNKVVVISKNIQGVAERMGSA